MRKTFLGLTFAAAIAAGMAVSTGPASAACTKLGFSVNDYGKDGPTKDAKELLDKYIAKWAAEKGITKYTTGKKDVTCELFLNFILFDEHTCKAEASVCWDGPPVKTGETAAAGDAAAPAEKKAKAAAAGTATEPAEKKAAAAKPAKVEKAAAPTETGSTTAHAVKEAAPAAKEKAAPAEAAAPAAETEHAAKPEAAPAAAQ